MVRRSHLVADSEEKHIDHRNDCSLKKINLKSSAKRILLKICLIKCASAPPPLYDPQTAQPTNGRPIDGHEALYGRYTTNNNTIMLLFAEAQA